MTFVVTDAEEARSIVRSFGRLITCAFDGKEREREKTGTIVRVFPLLLTTFSSNVNDWLRRLPKWKEREREGREKKALLNIIQSSSLFFAHSSRLVSDSDRSPWNKQKTTSSIFSICSLTLDIYSFHVESSFFVTQFFTDGRTRRSFNVEIHRRW